MYAIYNIIIITIIIIIIIIIAYGHFCGHLALCASLPRAGSYRGWHGTIQTGLRNYAPRSRGGLAVVCGSYFRLATGHCRIPPVISGLTDCSGETIT